MTVPKAFQKRMFSPKTMLLLTFLYCWGTTTVSIIQVSNFSVISKSSYSPHLSVTKPYSFYLLKMFLIYPFLPTHIVPTLFQGLITFHLDQCKSLNCPPSLKSLSTPSFTQLPK